MGWRHKPALQVMRKEDGMDKATANCANCGNNGHWYESDPQYEGDVVSEIFVFVECPQCRYRTASYLDDEQAAGDWNEGKLLPPNGKSDRLAEDKQEG